MGTERPILMITLVIPGYEDVSSDQILDAIGQQLGQALETLKSQQSGQVIEEPESPEDVAFRASVINESIEAFTDETGEDILATLGYSGEAE